MTPQRRIRRIQRWIAKCGSRTIAPEFVHEFHDKWFETRPEYWDHYCARTDVADELMAVEIEWLCRYALGLDAIVDEVNATANNMQIDIERLRYANQYEMPAKLFSPTPGEFSGCRCVDCPEKRDPPSFCRCCAENRECAKSPDPEVFV
jgi:hypothetical protein